MAGLSTPQGSNMKFVSLKKDKEVGDFNFCLHEKVNGEWAVTEKHKRFEGQLLDVELESFEWNNEKIPTIALFFKSEDSIYKIECNYNILSRSVINTLSSQEEAIKNGDTFQIDLYVSKKGYNAIIVKNTKDVEERLPWLVSFEDQPAMEKKEFAGKTLIDDRAVNDFFKKMIEKRLKPMCPGLPKHEEREQPKDSEKKPMASNEAVFESEASNKTAWPTPSTEKTPPSRAPMPDDDDLPF